MGSLRTAQSFPAFVTGLQTIPKIAMWWSSTKMTCWPSLCPSLVFKWPDSRTIFFIWFWKGRLKNHIVAYTRPLYNSDNSHIWVIHKIEHDGKTVPTYCNLFVNQMDRVVICIIFLSSRCYWEKKSSMTWNFEFSLSMFGIKLVYNTRIKVCQ